MRHQEFLTGVATRAGFDQTDDARLAATAVLAAVSGHLTGDDRTALAEALPSLLEHEAGLDDAPASATGTSLVDEVARRTGWQPERAGYALTAVLEQLTAEDDALGRRIVAALPGDLDVHGGPAVPPAADVDRTPPVDPDELDRALAGLVDWTGDVTGIERTIAMPDDRLERVLERVHSAEQELGQRVRILDRSPGSLTVRARTESLQVVTEIDLALAQRVDEAVDAVS